MKIKKLGLIAVVVTLVVVFFWVGGREYLSLTYLKSQLDLFKELLNQQPGLTVGVFALVYIASTALSLPGATVLTLLAGALFGVVQGTIIVSFASSIGATLAFLATRYLFYDSVQAKFGARLASINEGVKRDGASYLLTLRLIPVVPFFLVNLLLGLTPLPTARFYIFSQIGMFPGTIAYVNAGTELARIESMSGLISPRLIGAFALLGLLPLLLRPLATWISSRKIYGRYAKPKSFDYNIVIIGAGSAGLVTAYIAAAVKAKVALIEKHKMGGDCLNTGCVPSKALIRSARFVSDVKRAREFGMRSANVDFDFAQVMNRVQDVIKRIEPHDSVERYTGLGVECISGSARLVSPWEVEVNGRKLTTKNVVVATGARPRVPDIPGLDKTGYYTSDTIWNMMVQPKNLLVLGGGPIGCELAQAFASLGSQVTIVDRAPRILIKEDPEVAAHLTEVFNKLGIRIHCGAQPLRFDGKKLVAQKDNREMSLEFDQVLVALGRVANVSGFGLEELGVEIASAGTIELNPLLQTNIPNIYACGDVAGPFQFTHAASHQAWYCAVNALFGPLKTYNVDYRFLPWSTFTSPEIARIGLSEDEAKAKNIPYEVTRYGIDDLDRAIADSADEGFVKVLTPPGKDTILGVTIVAEHASDMLPEFVTAMKHGLGLNKILGTIHAYPTMSEANKYAAGVWKKAHAPAKALEILAKFHTFRRR